ncbi:MAG TPA: DUF3795 domain-containing protein [Methanoregula sp.]|nr:DUF3795 domain-containing protein [Methanoregula sp.]
MDRDPELVAPCGINCAVCSAYLARQHDLRKHGIRMPYCAGCRARNKQCALLKKRCARIGEGSLRFCSGCPDFPCRQLAGLDRRYRDRYGLSPLANLAVIRDNGTAAFMDREEARWRCPSCGGTVSCHHGTCFDCGIDRLRAR